MDSLNFRRTCLEDPNNTGSDFRDAWQNDAELAAFRQSVLDTDEQLRKALDVEIPEGLAARLELECLLKNQSADKPAKGGKLVQGPWARLTERPLAMAASVAVALMVGVWAFNQLPVRQADIELTQGLTPIEQTHYTEVNHALAHAVVAHAGHEGNSPVSVEAAERFAYLLIDYGLPVNAADFAPRYASHCPIKGKRILHALLDGEESNVTLVYAAERLTEMESEVMQDGIYTRVKPLGKGTLIMSGESMREVNSHLAKFMQSIQDTEVLARI